MKNFKWIASLALVLACTASTQAALFDLETKITAADAAAFDQFGSSVAISGNKALVGAQHYDDVGSFSGSAYLFENVIPEPSTLLLGGIACLGSFLRRNR